MFQGESGLRGAGSARKWAPRPASCGPDADQRVFRRWAFESEFEHESQAVFHLLQESSRQRSRFLDEPPPVRDGEL